MGTVKTFIGNIKGAPGKTAYQYALDAGYTGTEEDFAAKLNEGAVESYSKEEADAKFLTTESDPTVPAWAKEEEKPTYTAEEVGADERGAAAAMLTEAKKYTDEEIAELINGAPTTLDTLGEIATAMAENADVVEALNLAIGSKADARTVTDLTGVVAGKAAASDLTAHTENKNNPHGMTAAQLGLSTETWTFTLEDGSTVTKAVYVG